MEHLLVKVECCEVVRREGAVEGSSVDDVQN
jgi:hypothetical protein